MAADKGLPKSTARLSDETQTEILRLSIRGRNDSEIARQIGVHRHTVRRVLDRTRAALVINGDVERERAHAVRLYREVQRVAWEAIDAGADDGRLLGRLLAEVRQAQARIDLLYGLEPPKG